MKVDNWGGGYEIINEEIVAYNGNASALIKWKKWYNTGGFPQNFPNFKITQSIKILIIDRNKNYYICTNESPFREHIGKLSNVFNHFEPYYLCEDTVIKTLIDNCTKKCIELGLIDNYSPFDESGEFKVSCG